MAQKHTIHNRMIENLNSYADSRYVYTFFSMTLRVEGGG
jgi:hypothetical protein